MDHYVTDLEPIPRSPQRGKEVHLIAGNRLLWLWSRCRPRTTSPDPRTLARGPAQAASKNAKVYLKPMIVEWVDASHATKTDGRSTTGILIDLTEMAVIHGDEMPGLVSRETIKKRPLRGSQRCYRRIGSKTSFTAFLIDRKKKIR